MDLARAPRRAPLTARKKGSGYENGVRANWVPDYQPASNYIGRPPYSIDSRSNALQLF